MALIPEDKIQEIKNAADIVSVISESVSLKRAGQNMVGLCPFHNEKTGSFSVSPAKQMFYCFGCGAGGNVIKFLMLKDGLSFPESARALAQRYGVHLDLDAKTKEILSKKDRLFLANKKAQEFYAGYLFKGADKRGLEYLEKRGVSMDTIKKFGLGLAPNNWDSLLQHLRQNGISYEEAERAGLAIPRKDSNGYYDRFRGRLMFPIYDESNRVTGFGGRVLNDELPKYLNSPETELYSKSRSLYGLHASKGAVLNSGEVFIVEGYMDALMLFQNSVENVAATLGTAMTSDHVKLLKRYAKKRIMLVYDSDEAGIRSARRCVEIFLAEHADFSKNDVFTEENADTHILILPEGHDPDSYVREKGAARFHELARKAYGIIPFLLNEAVKKYGEAVEGKIKVIHELMPTLAAINDKVAQSLYIKQVAERLGLDEVLVWEELRNAYKRKRGMVNLSDKPQGKSIAHKIAANKTDRYEVRIAGLCLQFPEYMNEMILAGLRLEFFKDPNVSKLMHAMWDFGLKDPTEVGRFIESMEDDTVRALAYRLSMQNEDCELKTAVLLVKNFVELNTKHKAKDNLAKIRAAEDDNDEELLHKLLVDKQKSAQKKEEQKRSLQKRQLNDKKN